MSTNWALSPTDGITNPKYKLMNKREEATSLYPGYVLPSIALFTADSLPLMKLSLLQYLRKLRQKNYGIALFFGHYPGVRIHLTMHEISILGNASVFATSGLTSSPLTSSR